MSMPRHDEIPARPRPQGISPPPGLRRWSRRPAGGGRIGGLGTAHRRTGILAGMLTAVSLCLVPAAHAVADRFPRPDFVSGHVPPPTEVPPPPQAWLPWLDVGALLAALILATLFSLRWRSRKGLLALTIASLLYFGFWRHGCICPVGAVQNVCAGLADKSHALSAAVVFLFVLPVAFALFFGRVFCSSVCPLGAIQELVVVRHRALPFWVNRLLGMGRYLVLGLGVFCAVGGIGFIVCRYDPFVGFFRLGGPAPMLLAGAALLALGTVIGRPACRFLCPYGAVLEWASRLSWKRLSITPAECIRCRLCESACPYDAIEKPESVTRQTASHAVSRRTLGLALLLFPLLLVLGSLGGGRLGLALGRFHPAVSLARTVTRDGHAADLGMRDRIEAFESAEMPREQLAGKARAIQEGMLFRGRLLGIFGGAVLGLHLVALSRRISHEDYRPDPAACLGCGRCFRYCPVPAASKLR